MNFQAMVRCSKQIAGRGGHTEPLASPNPPTGAFEIEEAPMTFARDSGIDGENGHADQSRSFASVSRTARRLIVVLLFGTLVSGCGFNSIPTYEEQAKAKWSEVQNQYQRRSDLIPNLVETVRGIAQQERTVFEAVTVARARATSVQVNADTITDPAAFKKFQEAQAQLSGALGRLIAISENYPDLKSNQNFLALQSQLEGTENRIAVSRRDYIEAVRLYNTELKTLPGSFWASTFYSKNKPMEVFAVADDVKQLPKVKF